jgi:hypothetical protein
MKTYAHIENGAVANIVVAEIADDLGADTGIFVEVSAEGPVPGIGWSYAAGGFVPPAPPAVSKDAINAPILAEIAGLDSKRVRPTAEIAEAVGTGTAPAQASVARLVELNNRIAALRAQLVPS